MKTNKFQYELMKFYSEADAKFLANLYSGDEKTAVKKPRKVIKMNLPQQGAEPEQLLLSSQA